MAINIHPSFAIHAGEWLKTEIVEARGISINDLAAAFGVNRSARSSTAGLPCRLIWLFVSSTRSV
ncbi:hypothetical protein [Sphingobium herbicidovorans]|uniref:hypothetical protein n=1 Tax=Sphingobium herbicidovorans TaxID=76947 RepID=UPI000A5FB048|nr:hypothetical protein [Sphingobium herbicidovorans]